MLNLLQSFAYIYMAMNAVPLLTVLQRLAHLSLKILKEWIIIYEAGTSKTYDSRLLLWR